MVKEYIYYSSLIHNINNTDAFLKGITSLLAFLPLHKILVCFFLHVSVTDWTPLTRFNDANVV